MASTRNSIASTSEYENVPINEEVGNQESNSKQDSLLSVENSVELKEPDGKENIITPGEPSNNELSRLRNIRLNRKQIIFFLCYFCLMIAGITLLANSIISRNDSTSNVTNITEQDFVGDIGNGTLN